ncbi:MAG: Arc family DNA-binding protein [Bryobacteraceae bacterium]|nr:Arc family DNA-binding protein [Bryobacteraceae bacterium]
MAERKSFLIRVDERVLDQVKKWADDDLRSLNGQIEFLLRDALVRAKRWRAAAEELPPNASDPLE